VRCGIRNYRYIIKDQLITEIKMLDSFSIYTRLGEVVEGIKRAKKLARIFF
jgi:hypothetical protein